MKLIHFIEKKKFIMMGCLLTDYQGHYVKNVKIDGATIEGVEIEKSQRR